MGLAGTGSDGTLIRWLPFNSVLCGPIFNLLMNALSQLLKNLLRVTLVFAIFAAIVIGLFVAWWIAVCLVLGISGYLAVRRFLGAAPAARGGHTQSAEAVVVEGEYRVEEDAAVVQQLDSAVDATKEQPERHP